MKQKNLKLCPNTATFIRTNMGTVPCR